MENTVAVEKRKNSVWFVEVIELFWSVFLLIILAEMLNIFLTILEVTVLAEAKSCPYTDLD